MRPEAYKVLCNTPNGSIALRGFHLKKKDAIAAGRKWKKELLLKAEDLYDLRLRKVYYSWRIVPLMPDTTPIMEK